jgi:hypothetical protein
MARHPSSRRLSTLSSIPWESWKRETSASGGAFISLVKVLTSQWT